jgi:hypothetical protein
MKESQKKIMPNVIDVIRNPHSDKLNEPVMKMWDLGYRVKSVAFTGNEYGMTLVIVYEDRDTN